MLIANPIIIAHHYHHLSRKTSTARLRAPPRSPKITAPGLPASSGFLQPSLGRRFTLQEAYSRSVFQYVVATSRTLCPHRQSCLRAMCPAHCHLRLAILRVMSVTLVRLQISSFLIQSCRETPSIDLSIALLVPHEW